VLTRLAAVPPIEANLEVDVPSRAADSDDQTLVHRGLGEQPRQPRHAAAGDDQPVQGFRQIALDDGLQGEIVAAGQCPIGDPAEECARAVAEEGDATADGRRERVRGLSSADGRARGEPIVCYGHPFHFIGVDTQWVRRVDVGEKQITPAVVQGFVGVEGVGRQQAAGHCLTNGFHVVPPTGEVCGGQCVAQRHGDRFAWHVLSSADVVSDCGKTGDGLGCLGVKARPGVGERNRKRGAVDELGADPVLE